LCGAWLSTRDATLRPDRRTRRESSADCVPAAGVIEGARRRATTYAIRPATGGLAGARRRQGRASRDAGSATWPTAGRWPRSWGAWDSERGVPSGRGTGTARTRRGARAGTTSSRRTRRAHQVLPCSRARGGRRRAARRQGVRTAAPPSRPRTLATWRFDAFGQRRRWSSGEQCRGRSEQCAVAWRRARRATQECAAMGAGACRS
jgi:hypothetical protein